MTRADDEPAAPPRRLYRVRRVVSGQTPPRHIGLGRVLAVALLCSLLGGLAGAGLALRAQTPAPPPAALAPTAPGATDPAPSVPAARVSIEFQSAISDAAEKAGPAVVGILNQVRQRSGFADVGTGSGVIFDRNRGLIVTNHHVVDIDPGYEQLQRLLVQTAAGEFLEARLVGSDELTDLAVIQVQSDALPTQAEFGDSDRLKVGDIAIAIGNPLGLDFQRTVTAGIISGINRELTFETAGMGETTLQVLQTDAAINPGNSGGALVNAAGQLVGINSAKIARSGVEGIGFAIPINFARPIISDLVAHGRVLRPVLGITAFRNQAEQRWRTGYGGEGLVVVDVIPGGPADQAGIQPGDILLDVAGRPVNRLGELVLALGAYHPGDEVTVRVRRITRTQVQEYEVSVRLQGAG